jgi:hypothetical protein
MTVGKNRFLWKLTENYLNAIMVLVLSFLIVRSIVYNDSISLLLAIIWVIIIPFMGTFIDMKSNSK